MLPSVWRSSSLHKSAVLTLFVIFYICNPIVNDAIAGINAFDAVVTVKKPIKLKALTKGRFFSEGGKLVEFHIDNEHIGTSLSGGDGYAFLTYTPQSIGIKKIKLKRGEQSDNALLLVTDKKDRVILIAIEAGLFESILSWKPAEGAKEAIRNIAKKFRIIYVTSIIGVKQSRKWLQENKLHESIVFSWTGNSLIEDLREKGIHIFAIIGSPNIHAEIKESRKFSFSETDEASVVESWEDLSEELMKK